MGTKACPPYRAADDREAPAADSAATLERLAAAGKPYSNRLFAHTDHGMVRYLVRNGERVTTGYDPDYYRAVLEFWQRQFGLPPVAQPAARLDVPSSNQRVE